MFYSYKNIKIHYQVIGSGKPIFMIHGLDCDLNLMKGCFEPIFKNKNGYKRIYIDLPGMGKSKSLLEYASSDKILDILISFAENIISENFIVCFFNTFSHGKIKIWNSLSTMHIVLISLNSNTS